MLMYIWYQPFTHAWINGRIYIPCDQLLYTDTHNWHKTEPNTVKRVTGHVKSIPTTPVADQFVVCQSSRNIRWEKRTAVIISVFVCLFFLAIQCRHAQFPNVCIGVNVSSVMSQNQKGRMQKKYALRKSCPKLQIWPDVGQSSHREIDHTADQNKELDRSHLYESSLWLHIPHCDCVNECVRGQVYIQGLTG